MSQTQYEAAVAEFIRSNDVTRCPTVCLAPTQGSVDPSDRVALRRRAERLEKLHQQKRGMGDGLVNKLLGGARGL